MAVHITDNRRIYRTTNEGSSAVRRITPAQVRTPDREQLKHSFWTGMWVLLLGEEVSSVAEHA